MGVKQHGSALPEMLQMQRSISDKREKTVKREAQTVECA